MYGHHLLYNRVICTGGTALLLFVFVYIQGIFLIWGHVHSCTVHSCICIYV